MAPRRRSVPTMVTSGVLGALLLGWSAILALHPTDWSSPMGAVLGLLAGLAASGVHRHAAAPVLTASGLVLLARPFVRPVQYFHLGRWHDLDLTTRTHGGMLTRGGLLLALAVIVVAVLLREGSTLRAYVRGATVAVVTWAIHPLLGDGDFAWVGERWIAAWTGVAAAVTVAVVVAGIVDEVRARRSDVTLVPGSLFLP